MKPSAPQEVNKTFYNELYKGKGKLINLMYPFISYDQQSKSKANFFFARNIINKNSSILDYGFGHGSFLLKLSSKNKLYGIDISDEAVANFPKVAKFYGKNVRTATPEYIHKIISYNSLDMICLSHVLEHVDDDRAILKELSGLLAPEGFFLINIPINEVWQDPKHVRTYDLASIEQVLLSIGFHISEHFMFDKTTAFLLTNEQKKKPLFLKKFFLRSFRFILSFAPFSFYRLLDKSLFKRYANQQLIVLAQKS